MKKKRFTEDQIIGILREQEVGAKAADLARKYVVSETTLYNWNAKFGGMVPSRIGLKLADPAPRQTRISDQAARSIG